MPQVYYLDASTCSLRRFVGCNKQLLAAQDWRRAEQFNHSQARLRFQSGRILLRHLFAGSCVRPGITISQTRFGKPFASGGGAFEFSISHGDEYVAVAISPRAAVGVDLESMRRKNNVLRIARQYFTAQENRDMHLATDPQKYFYRLWTLKEAYVKARGMGLRKALSEMAFSIKDSIAFYDQESPADEVQFYSCELTRDIVMGLCYVAPGPATLEIFAMDADLLARPVQPELLVGSAVLSETALS